MAETAPSIADIAVCQIAQNQPVSLPRRLDLTRVINAISCGTVDKASRFLLLTRLGLSRYVL